MPFQLFDVLLGGVMLVSALLALMRGFTREVLSLIAWGLAALAAAGAFYSADMREFALQYVQPEALAIAVSSGVVFLVVLIVVSLITVKIADMILDSSAGPFDRTLGFFYGLGRGFLLIVVAYMFYAWLIPANKREDWIRTAGSLPPIEATCDFVVSLLPAKFTSSMEGTRGCKFGVGADAVQTQSGDQAGESGYKKSTTMPLDNLIESSQQNKATQQGPPQQTPQFGNQNNTGTQN
jgi:membrane protein required for colicin V production